MYDAKNLSKLVGHQVKKVFMNSEYLKFVLEDGTEYGFAVEGDCCSTSYFYDFIGLDKLLTNKVVSAKSVSLADDDPRAKLDATDGWDDEIEVYGYEIVTEDPKFGEVTTVFSFRNASNGYYGGWMYDCDNVPSTVPELKADTTEIQE